MHSSLSWRTGAAAFVAVACGLAGCDNGKAPRPLGGSFVTPTEPTTVSALCTAARSAEPLPPRVDLTGMNASTVGGQDVAYTSDLMDRFYSLCGGCHVDASRGDRNIKKNNLDAFIATFDSSWVAPIMLDDKDKRMPQPGEPWSTRPPNDPVVQFVNYANAWLAAGKPRNVFAIDSADSGGGSATANYTFSTAVAAAMTNIGNCVPTPALFASSTSGVMTSRDEFFRTATALPSALAETDLTTLDSEELARTAVIAYAPTYALWSAGSGKLRHIRVPRGETVKFDKQTQSFDIPDNTRFYKTFLRAVRDRTGETRWRKMETRIIVARADDVDPATGEARQNALYGTYIWSEDETTATLATQPYRDQTPWKDIVRTYIKDELLYQNILDTTTGTVDGAVALAIKKNKDDPAYRDLLQRYAIPGRLRCVQCHMGSPTKDFVLGFIPLQVARRATDTGGTYDPTGADELNQLQRLIDLGVISGIASLADVKPLEESQGGRKPRKTATADGDALTGDGELTAQAYMLGNCAHCHNPRGFPSISKPELATLNFLPDTQDGGIFGFSFERMSPVRARGANADIPIPYITPSLRDYPVTTEDGGTRIDTGASLISGESGAITYTPKFAPNGPHTCADVVASVGDVTHYCGDRTTGPAVVAAPWRSLIYRNVETPAAYFDDFVPFPHMPMNTAGFDCRAPRIMGDWMVGLPSERKLVHLARLLGQPGVKAPSEDALPKSVGRAPLLGSLDTGYDDNPQPYMEIPPDSALYEKALADARARLVEYHAGVRYPYCQDILSPDIVDPFVPVNAPEYAYHPNPNQYQLSYIESPAEDPLHPGRFVQPRIGVPFHAHWIDYDPTDPPPPWAPRRTEWEAILVERKPDTAVPVGTKPLDQLDPEKARRFRRDREVLVRALNEAQLTDELRAYATTEKPYGLWKVKPECEQKLAASQKKVSELALNERPDWLDVVKAPATAPVYMMSPGAAIYRHVCINCHGPNADGKGLQVDLLAAASEGEARPANFRDGLFGPSGQPLANVLSTFDVTRSGNMTIAALWGSRYMAWMAMGGTLKRIPQDIVQLVAATRIMGHSRQNLYTIPGASDATGNMLNLAKGLCAIVLPAPTNSNEPYDFDAHLPAFDEFSVVGAAAYPPYNHSGSPFIESNYDKEMWLRLCNDFSPRVVRVYGTPGALTETPEVKLIAIYYASDPDEPTNLDRSYPADRPVWDHMQREQMGVSALPSDNFYPACLDPEIPPEAVPALRMPRCPPGFLSNGRLLWRHQGLGLKFPFDDQRAFGANVEAWKDRGGIATGMAVFSYLRQRVTDPSRSKLPPYYDQCELLP
jgi:mono/diheme cytochrome c family protein